MGVSFENLIVGEEYDRPTLAELWNYKGFQAISRGVVTPADTNLIVLFVTKEKQADLIQYQDIIEGNTLYWEGEEKHSSDRRISQSLVNDDEVHLFYRDIHHLPFVYYGRVYLEEYRERQNYPSEFVFNIPAIIDPNNSFFDIKSINKNYGLDTEKNSIVKSRLGQGIFRKDLIDYWQGCSVTGIKKTNFLKASHIKPWCKSANHERLDPMNGLLLIPALDHMFDFGMITFNRDGNILISKEIDRNIKRVFGIYEEMKLRNITDKHQDYLEFHRKNVFHSG